VKILIADDDAVSRRLLERTLLRAGYEVVAVVNGRQAVENLTGPDMPRLVLLDWMMPELDGPGVCREIRNRRDQSYVYMILLTSRESKEDVIAGLESGADDYLIKPFIADELKARLRVGERILHLEDRLISRISTIGTATWSGTRFCENLLAACCIPCVLTILWDATVARNSSSCSIIAVRIPRSPAPRRFARAFVLAPCRPMSVPLKSP
jgi:CheY-like chemotaxis protein